MIITVWTSQVILLLLILLPVALAGGGKGNKQLEKMLLAGLVAKALAKGGEGGGGGGGGGPHYMPIPVPIPHSAASSGGGGMQASSSHHHHVHHKYVPIPVKHHTNFIIAHHKVHVPVKVPYPVYKTKVVHVPVEQTKLVPIIVTAPPKSAPPHRPRYPPRDYGPPYSSDSRKYYRNHRPRKSRYSSQSIPRRWIVVVKHKHRHYPVKRTIKK